MTKTVEVQVFREPVDGVNRQRRLHKTHHFRVEALKGKTE